MTATLHIRTRIDSETHLLQGLRAFVGKSVDIMVMENAPAENRGLSAAADEKERAAGKKPNVELMEQLARQIYFDDDDEKAFWELRRMSTI